LLYHSIKAATYFVVRVLCLAFRRRDCVLCVLCFVLSPCVIGCVAALRFERFHFRQTLLLLPAELFLVSIRLERARFWAEWECRVILRISAATFGRNSALSDPLSSVVASIPRSSPTRPVFGGVSRVFVDRIFPLVRWKDVVYHGFQALVVVD